MWECQIQQFRPYIKKSMARCVLLDRQQNGRKKKAKLWPLRKGPFDQQLDYSNQLRKGKKKRRLKGGARRPDYFDRRHRAGGVQRRTAAYSGAAMAAAPGYMAEQLAFPCSLSSEIVRREQCDKRSLSSHIFCAQKANDLRHLLFTPTRADTCRAAGRAEGQTGSLGSWAAMLQLNSPISPSVFFTQCAIADVISKGASLYEILISDCRGNFLP